METIPTCRLIALGTIVGTALCLLPARAQIMPGAGLGGAKSGGSAQQPAPPPPPALPGARVDREMVAPPDRAPSDLAPNEALFDSINRGDIASARDALSRGADLNARSVLGMTPLELSIDLGRKDISFLLLSMRGSGGNSGPPPEAAAKSVRPEMTTKAQRPLQGRAAGRAPLATQARVAPPAAPQTPRLFAGDGGAPVPSAGFRGFDASGVGAR
jgi:hypothetical protein